MSSGRMSAPIPERSWRCSTLLHQRSIWLCTIAGSSTKRAQRAGDRGEEFPTGKDTDAAGSSGFDRHFFVVGFNALTAKARIDGSEKGFRDGRLSEGQELRFVEARLGALGFGIE